MVDRNYTDGETVIEADWLNYVNERVNEPSAGSYDVGDEPDEVPLNSDVKYSPKWVTWNSESDSYSGNPGTTDTHLNIRRCVMNSDGTVNYYLSETDSTLREDGSSANLDGSDGMVMVEIPKFWVKFEYNGDLYTYYVSPVSRDGYEVHPAFVVGDTEHDYIYYSAYDACVYDDSEDTYISGNNQDDATDLVDLSDDHLASVSDVYPMVGLQRSEFRTLASNYGDGNWHQPDFWMVQAIQLLYLVEYGSFDAQDKIGRGNVDRDYESSSSDQDDSPHVVAGLSDSYGNKTASVDDETGDPFISYRGIENFWGNCWNWVDGFNIDDRQGYVTTDHTVFDDDTSTDYDSIGDSMPSADDDPIRNWQDVDFAFLPSDVGGDASTSAYVTDHFWTDSGWRVARIGGLAGSGSRAGAWCWGLNDSASNRSRYVGARVARRD